MNKPYVIAIAAVSGGGKTTLTTYLANMSEHSTALHFDEYEFTKEPSNLSAWAKRNGGYGEWDLQPMEEDLKRIIEMADIDVVLLDYPFARLHDQISAYIDETIFLDVPLDIAMARRVIRNPPEHVVSEMSHYINHARSAYLKMIREVIPSSDRVLDGTLHVESLAEQVLEGMRESR